MVNIDYKNNILKPHIEPNMLYSTYSTYLENNNTNNNINSINKIVCVCIIVAHIYYLIDLLKIGGIIFRTNSANERIFTPINILRIMKAPLHIIHFWTRPLIFSNYFFILFIGYIIGKILSLIFN